MVRENYSILTLFTAFHPRLIICSIANTCMGDLVKAKCSESPTRISGGYLEVCILHACKSVARNEVSASKFVECTINIQAKVHLTVGPGLQGTCKVVIHRSENSA